MILFLCQINLGNSPADDYLWIAGGYFTYTYHISVTGAVTYGTGTPKTLNGACVVQLLDGKLLIMGKVHIF